MMSRKNHFPSARSALIRTIESNPENLPLIYAISRDGIRAAEGINGDLTVRGLALFFLAEYHNWKDGKEYEIRGEGEAGDKG